MAAFQHLSVPRIAAIHADGTEATHEHIVMANTFVLELVERVILERIQRMKGGKDLPASVANLWAFVATIKDAIPVMGAVPDGTPFDARVRCERLRPQVVALNTLSQYAHALELGVAQARPWPSVVKEAKSLLMSAPKTRLGLALETYGGAKAMLAKALPRHHVSISPPYG